ncbi:helix-turn-helix transcriptional regulator [Streptomyces kaniharaensis]|uniref:Helix-turn-helix transcriptional regulator n=1 Tax=Streptomyces kaniharaensis TaxID=212423 RepID=A0A6N7KYJ9_9ACTN|nr:helix-turn-helix transcriptional regulator [Streptomyces kaniharaensis]
MMNRKELDPDASRTAEFGVCLRAARMDHGWTQEGLAERIGYSGVHVSAVETDRKPPTLLLARRIDLAFGTPGRFERMWRRSRRGVLFEGFEEYLRSEAEAVALRLFEINIIPGLLQIPAYVCAYQGALVRRGASTRQQADERTAVLLRRQKCLAEKDPAPLLHAVMDEGCLRRSIGDREVMIEQLLHLEALAAQPRVILQVSPFSLGENRPFAHPMTLLTMPNRAMVGYSETQKRGFLEREPDTLAEWANEYDQLQVEALPRAASVEFIRDVRRGIEHG